MKARIRNATDVAVERLHRDASVADQLKFQAWPEESKIIARRAVALEIDKAASEGSDADSELGDAVAAVRLHVGELKAHIEKFVALVIVPGASNPSSDAEVARSKVIAELAELVDAVGELEIAAEADAE